ncbi:cytosine permease, partial [Eubacteriales bacterium DFI.9.88]|nr:cytosine permease [Eubacteriales bacterium DFI.9.88]
ATSVTLANIAPMVASTITEVAYGEAQFDPTAVLLHLNNKFVVLVVSLGVIIGTLTTNMAANVVAPANGFANLAPKKISYRVAASAEHTSEHIEDILKA